MKYFRIFRNTEEYIEYMETAGAVVPNISYCSEDNKTYITPSDVPPPTPLYRWYAVDINEEWVCSGGNKYYKEYYQISYDGGDTWENVSPEQTRAGTLYEEMSWDCTDYSAMYFTIHSLEDSNVIHIRRSGPTGNTEYYSIDNGSTWSTMTSGSGDKTIVTLNSGDTMLIKCTATKWANTYNTNNALYSTKNIKVYGNIMSLLYGDNFTGQTTVGEFGLCGLFFGTSATGTSNTKLVSAKNLVLPATELAISSYNGMFRGCSNLVDCPRVLPATTLYQDTYSSMFEGCTSLVEGPEIMATTIATTGSSTCMMRMFCMNRNSRVTAAMTKSPVLRIATGVNSCYKEMFKGNGNLAEITCLLISGPSNCCDNWVTNAGTDTGTFKKAPSATWTSYVPHGWTIEDYVEE